MYYFYLFLSWEFTGCTWEGFVQTILGWTADDQKEPSRKQVFQPGPSLSDPVYPVYIKQNQINITSVQFSLFLLDQLAYKMRHNGTLYTM